MKIKEIKLYGFKSFCDEIKIALTEGITAFVGPNGSGKSNIFDALRWVFGEQSMKTLRCERTEDLIFESVDAKNDARFTEVSIIIENEDYFPQFGGEFEIKRRFYKTGESEFFLNRAKCRLYDIQALFLNSGTLTYSFLELAEIEKIIHGDTKEMFDDVSGILKYRERRSQTQRRLEATEQDLLRLEDIILEMQRGLRSLKRQVRQTRLYQELKEDYKILSLYLMKNEYSKALQNLEHVQEKIDEQETQKQLVLQEIKKSEKEREILKNEMTQAEIMKKEIFGKVVLLNEKIDDLQNKIDVKEAEIQQITLACERALTSIKEKKEILNNNNERLKNLQNGRNDILSRISQSDFAIREKQKELDTKNERFFSLKNDLKNKEDMISELSIKAQTNITEISKLHFERENKKTILFRITEEYNSQNLEIDTKRRLNKELESTQDTIVKQQEEAVTHLEQKNQTLNDRENKVADMEIDLQKRQQAITDCKFIIETLSHRLKEGGGNKEIEKKFDKKIKGLLRNNLNVVDGYESIVDICFGDLLNFYLLTSFDARDFNSLPEGRFGFIDTKNVFEKKEPPELPTGVSAITQFVKFKSEQTLLQKYINHYYLVDDFDKAHELSQKYHDYGFVTRDGTLFKKGVIIVEKGDIGYFKISQSLTQHKGELETLQNEVVFTLEEKKRLESEIDEIKKQIEEEKNGLFTINVKKSENSLQLNEVIKSIEKMLKEKDVLKKDRDKLQKETDLLTAQIDKIGTEDENLKKEIEEITNQKSSLINSITQTSEELDEKNSLLNEMTLESAVLKERKNSIEQAIEQLRNEIQSIETEIAKLEEVSGATNLTDLNEVLKTVQAELEVKKKEKTEYESKLPTRLTEDFNERQNTIYDQLTQKQKAHEEIQNAIMQLKYQSFQLTHKKDEKIREVQEKFHVDLPSYEPEEINDAETKLAEAKGKLEKLGEVNPLSLELYESEKKRLDEFLSQRDDIITAKRNLLKSIEELDQRAQERFVDIFEQVKKEFNYVFSNFFEGGGADLILSDKDNPLTSQIGIIVRMSGKKLKTISQLSGGQRTLLAVSLLLAFYLVKPAPFCILDEIDAPLDDANVVRFNKFLRRLSQRTQVIIITHNRATMEYTDYIYGVTMEKPRQSKIISARLADLEKIEVDAAERTR